MIPCKIIPEYFLEVLVLAVMCMSHSHSNEPYRLLTSNSGLVPINDPPMGFPLPFFELNCSVINLGSFSRDYREQENIKQQVDTGIPYRMKIHTEFNLSIYTQIGQIHGIK